MDYRRFFPIDVQRALAYDPSGAWMPVLPPHCIRLSAGYPCPEAVPVTELGELSRSLIRDEVVAHSNTLAKVVFVSDRKYETVTELPGIGATREQLSMLQTRYRVARDLAADKDVLEVACGPGIGLGYLASRARRVVGGDYDEKLVEVARKHYGERVQVCQLDAGKLPFESATFDVVLLLEAIYYLPEPAEFLAEARRVLRDGGVLMICSANPERPDFNRSPFSFNYYSASELCQLVSQMGFTVELSAGYPVREAGLKSRLLGVARRLAVRLKLIPETMRGKEFLKRLVYGNLLPLPAELTERTGKFLPPIAIDWNQDVRDYKVIYAIGRLRSR